MISPWMGDPNMLQITFVQCNEKRGMTLINKTKSAKWEMIRVRHMPCEGYSL